MKSTLLLICLLIASTLALSQSLSPAEVRDRIEKATPPALPQEPRTSKATTDAQDEHLKGKVHVVTDSEIESNGSTRVRWEHSYDEDGYLTKEISYDYRGNPFDVRVFGYVDEKRVSKGASIRYAYDPPPMVAAPGAAAKTPQVAGDKRYDSISTFKFDDSKRLIERMSYFSSGDLARRTVYNYSGETVETVSYDKSGKEISREIEKFDSKGDLIEMSFPHPGGVYGTSVYNYKYETFDAAGNWLRATVTGKEGQYGGGQKDFQHTEVRTISYY